MFNSIYKNQHVLVTGHTGFKGSWLSIWLNMLGAKVIGLSLEDLGEKSNYVYSGVEKQINEDLRVDIRNYNELESVIKRTKPKFIFHLAAQALVKSAYSDPVDTMMTNAIGSANLLRAVYNTNISSTVIMVTSDKCYENVEWIWGYKETDRIGGKDPYSASKGMAELAIRCFTESYFKTSESKSRIAIVRAGNVIGGGDWSKNRIVPDCMSAWSKNKIVEIRSPQATRPWQHVLEPLSGYLHLASKLNRDSNLNGEAFNFGPPANQDITVEKLINEMKIHWQNINWKDISTKETTDHESGLLKLNCDKAKAYLDWEPNLNFSETVKLTVDWYKEYANNSSGSTTSLAQSQIAGFIELAKHNNRIWASN